MKISGIYNIRNLITDNIYIGSAVNLNNRWSVHKNHLSNNNHVNDHLQNAWNKYGKENFIFEIIEYVEDKNKLIEKEQLWMDFFKPEYNIRKVAENNIGVKWSDESRKKASDRMKGKDPWNKGKKGVSEETRIKLSESRRNRGNLAFFSGKKHSDDAKKKIGSRSKTMTRTPHSDETKAKISESKKGHLVSEETRKKISDINTGRIVSEETRSKISKSLNGKIVSEETKAKISESKRGHLVSEETRIKLSNSIKNYWNKKHK